MVSSLICCCLKFHSYAVNKTSNGDVFAVWSNFISLKIDVILIDKNNCTYGDKALYNCYDFLTKPMANKNLVEKVKVLATWKTSKGNITETEPSVC